MSSAVTLFIIGGLCLMASSTCYADEMCIAKVQNNDQYQRAVDHLLIAQTSGGKSDEQVTVNRIIMPGRENVTAIHWNCASHVHSYKILGMNSEGKDIVVGEIIPATGDSQDQDQPIATLVTISQ